jgi:tight adherence protein B
MVPTLTLVTARVLVELLAAVLGTWTEVLLPLVWIWLSRGVFHWIERRRADQLFRQFPDALATIVRSVRAGIPVGESIRLLGRDSPMPTAGEFKIIGDQIAMGVPFADAVKKLGGRDMLQEYRFFATALSLQSQTGGGLAETLDNLAEVIRKRVATKNRGRALAAEANASAMILAAMPIVTGLALWLLNPDYIALLFDNTRGQRILAFAVFLLGSGIAIMRYLIRRALS